jgi:hypothetical protein
MIVMEIQDENQKQMSQYNEYPAQDFANLVQRDPRLLVDLMLEVAESSRQHPDTAYVVPFTSIFPVAPIAKPAEFGWLFAGENDSRVHVLPTFATVQARINNLMPFAEDLSWNGYVTAGSFAALVCQPIDQEHMNHAPSDVDFYPYCSPQDRGSFSTIESAMTGYRQFLDDMTTAIEIRAEFLDSITKRNTNCTTIVTEINRHGPHKPSILTDYQIIHRAHTSPTSVVVGFDQMACKAFYDGEMVYFTLDAALCLYFGINPVDWRRESPSHLRRTHKYQQYGYTPIFPGLKQDLLSNSNRYYLPGCLLGLQHHFRNTAESKHKKTQEVYTTTEMFFEDSALKLYCKAKIDGAAGLPQYQLDEITNITFHCLNIKDVPAVPFSKEATESDYSGETTNSMAHAYHVLSMAIRDKFTLMSVYTEEAPNDIIDNANGIDVPSILKKLIVGRRSEFYFGTDRIYELQREMSQLVLTNHSRSIGVKLLNKKTLQQLTIMQEELKTIFDARVAELEALIKPQIAKLQAGVTFITSNPGAQFTASFKPIIRARPEDYWGCLYTPSKPSRLRQIKLTLLCIRKYHRTTLSLLDRNIIKMLFGYIDMAYFRCEIVEPYITARIPVVQHEVPAATVLFRNPVQVFQQPGLAQINPLMLAVQSTNSQP